MKKRLKELRKEKNLTQADVALLLNISRSTYSKVETGGTKLDCDRLCRLAKIYEVPPISLLGKSKSLNDNINDMLYLTHYSLSERLLSVIEYDKLTYNHLEFLKQKGIDNRSKYEDTPLGGRIYDFGPKDVFKIMIENYNMGFLFNSVDVKSKYFIKEYKEYENDKKNKSIETAEKEIEFDNYDYFLVYMASLEFSDGSEDFVEFAEKDITIKGDEYDMLEYVKTIKGAVSGDILCTSYGYTNYCEIIK